MSERLPMHAGGIVYVPPVPGRPSAEGAWLTLEERDEICSGDYVVFMPDRAAREATRPAVRVWYEPGLGDEL